MNSGDVPIGFGLALAMNEPAMQVYAKMTESRKQAVLTQAQNVRSKQEMQRLVAGIARQTLQ